MLLLLAVPITLTMTFAQRLLRIVAPSNLLTARVRATRPTLLRAGGMAALAWVLAAVAHGLSIAIAGGAAGWLNLVVLFVLWDAIKLMLAALLVGWRSAVAALHPPGGESSRPVLRGDGHRVWVCCTDG
ncbi:MAG: hypothetical protein JWP31_971 [Aeromicrobium sp.]|nr:hypothetical protein [Aeromicrobium sp.]